MRVSGSVVLAIEVVEDVVENVVEDVVENVVEDVVENVVEVMGVKKDLLDLKELRIIKGLKGIIKEIINGVTKEIINGVSEDLNASLHDLFC
jgi:hypothetical protein